MVLLLLPVCTETTQHTRACAHTRTQNQPTSLFPRFCYLKHRGIDTRIRAKKVHVSSHLSGDDVNVRHLTAETLEFSLKRANKLDDLNLFFRLF